MKYLKLFEGYFDEEFKNLLDKIKSEVDQYMYSITDEFQLDCSEDFITASNSQDLPGYSHCFVIYYGHIKYDEGLWEQFDKVEKTLKKIFNAKIRFLIPGDKFYGTYKKSDIDIRFNEIDDEEEEKKFRKLTIKVAIPNEFYK